MYFVVGEESGDALGARLIDTFSEIGIPVDPMGLAGRRMQERGVESLFDVSDISVMGISGVVAQLPKLLNRIKKTASDVIAKQPDVLILIDSPEFSYRVAKRVRKAKPGIKIVKYVAPSVWAWRPGRARKIKPFIDHILAVLPFEPTVLKELDGPACTYVGHPLAAEVPDIKTENRKITREIPNLVVLPGSRKSETKRLLPFIAETLEILRARGNVLSIQLPAVPKLEADIREVTKDWPYPVEVLLGDDARKNAFREGDLALSASGTVTLELALYKLPMISIYKLDGLAMRIRHLLTGWSASLPNLIADYPFVPERFNEYAHPHYVARMIERLLLNEHERQVQLDGFELVADRLQQDSPNEKLVAETILQVVKNKDRQN